MPRLCHHRPAGRVYYAGMDANAEQVRRGMAWVYVKYAPKGSALYAVQEKARAASHGLWADRNPAPPWEFRRKR
ncbi:MAG: thermonuclease family protein [Betaproteobacteria bacterium]|nr:thermonuclease family protein [Betaproteobacteria bacterium]